MERPLLLAGTRNGDILEIDMQPVYQSRDGGSRPSEDDDDPENSFSQQDEDQLSRERPLIKKIEKINMSSKLLMRNHAEQLPMNT